MGEKSQPTSKWAATAIVTAVDSTTSSTAAAAPTKSHCTTKPLLTCTFSRHIQIFTSLSLSLCRSVLVSVSLCMYLCIRICANVCVYVSMLFLLLFLLLSDVCFLFWHHSHSTNTKLLFVITGSLPSFIAYFSWWKPKKYITTTAATIKTKTKQRKKESLRIYFKFDHINGFKRETMIDISSYFSRKKNKKSWFFFHYLQQFRFILNATTRT